MGMLEILRTFSLKGNGTPQDFPWRIKGELL
jgi:hypothetical protein